MRRERGQERQERDQRHHRIDEVDAEPLHGAGKAHGVVLDTLRGAFDMPEPRPIGDEIVVHRGAPAKHVVADEEQVEHRHGDADERQRQELKDPEIELAGGDRAGGRQRPLDHVVEHPAPVVERNAHLDVEIGDEDDQRRAEDRPVLPGMRGEPRPKRIEERDPGPEIEVEPEKCRGEEAHRADDRRGIGGGGRQAQGAAELFAAQEPEHDEHQAPHCSRDKKRARTREKRDEHVGRNPLAGSGGGIRSQNVADWNGAFCRAFAAKSG